MAMSAMMQRTELPVKRFTEGTTRGPCKVERWYMSVYVLPENLSLQHAYTSMHMLLCGPQADG